MTKQIVIGKEGNQPFAIPDPKVSRRHAVLYVDEQGGRMMLMDIGSTNGTYLFNGNQFVRMTANQQYPVSGDTMIQLGPETRFHVKKLLAGQAKPQPPKPQPPKLEKIDIHKLRLISDRYTQNKMKLESRSGMINGLRSCTILVSILAGGLGGAAAKSFGIPEDDLLWKAIIGVLIGGFLMVVLLLIINSFNKKVIRERNENEHTYAVKYCCPNPKCKLPYRGKIYENILAEGRCPKCKAIYYDSSEKNS